MNEQFLFNKIRKYNSATSQTLKDAELSAAGIHAGLLPRSKAIARNLTSEERSRVVYFLRQFCISQGLEVQINE